MFVREWGNPAEIANRLGDFLKVCLFLVMAAFLAACNSGSLTDGLESARAPQPPQGVGTQDQNPTSPITQNNVASDATINQAPSDQVAGLPPSKAVAFLPVSNAPQGAVTNLARSIRSSASRNGVPVVGSVQDGAQYQVKGYFSALEDGSGTLLVYVWDVLDRSNKRVYRINGQEQTNSKSTDPWRSVTPEMLDRVAETTVAQLKSWLSSR